MLINFNKNKAYIYLYVFLIAAISYGFSFLLTIFVSRYIVIDWQLVSSKFLLPTTVLLNLLIIILLWLFFDKRLDKIDIKQPKIKFTIFLYIIAVVLTIIYQLHQGKSNFREITDILEKWPLFISIVVLIPIIEELVYREILVRFLYINGVISVISILFVSFLFTLTHIGLDSTNWLYMIYIFIIGITLLFIRIKNGLFASMITHIFINAIVWSLS